MIERALACRVQPADLGHLPSAVRHAHIRKCQSSAQPAADIPQPCPPGDNPGAPPFYTGAILQLRRFSA